MRPVTAVIALRSLRGSALLVVVIASLIAPAAAFARPASHDDLVDVIVSFNGPGGKQALKAAGGRVHRTFQLINAVSAQMPRGRMAALERKAGVKSVELDHKLAVFHHDPDTGNTELEEAWGVEHIGAGFVHDTGNTGQGIKVGVIDSGIDYNHPDLDTVYVDGWDFFNNDSDPFDDNGHGTHVAGTIAAELNDPPAGVVGVAPDVDLYAYKVVDADGNGDYSGLIAALDRAVTVDHVDVINMSLGGHTVSQALQDEVAQAYAAGVVLVAASGNVDPFTGAACPVAYPAAYEQVLSTSFTGPDDALTGYSCTGPELDFASPGDLINSTVPTGPCMFCDPSGYNGFMQGTSMASPHLAGAVALVLSHGIANGGDPTTLADDVKAHLCANTVVGTGITYFGIFHVPISPSDPRYPTYFGCGVVDAYKALITNPPSTGGGPNHPPVAADETATVAEDGSVSVSVLTNDTDQDGDALSVSTVGVPAHGTAVANTQGVVLYTPTANYAGSDSFTYVVSDGTATDTGNVTVTVTAVNDAPVANDDPASVAEDGSVLVGVLGNDVDVDSSTLSISSVGTASHGSAAVESGNVRYTPSSNFAGGDSFAYVVTDGLASDTGTVNVTVTAVNDPPVANDDSAAVTEDGSVLIDVRANDIDVDSASLTLTSVGPPSHGSATLDASGKVRYTPAANYAGGDSFTYVLSDDSATDSATVNVSVLAVNDPPVANTDTASTGEAQPVTIDVRANDTDVEGDSLSLLSTTQGVHGSTAMSGGSVVYTPAAGYSGPDSFTYTVSDGHGGSATGVVNVTVTAAPRQMHVGDLDATTTKQTKNWTAKVTVRIRNASGVAVSNVVVTGIWSTGETVTCTTGTGGNCTITKSKIANTRGSVTFQVTNATKTGWVYVAAANVDPDGDSNGTTITVAKP